MSNFCTLQVRCLIDKPLFVQRGQIVTGRVLLVSNRRQSYNVEIELQVNDVPGSSASNTLDLKNPYFRYTGQPTQAPPGCNTTSPSEDYWQQLDSTVGPTAAGMNGNMMLNGNSNLNGLNMNANHQTAPGQQIPIDPNQFVAAQQMQLNNPVVLNSANANQSVCNNRVGQQNSLQMGGGQYSLMGQPNTMQGAPAGGNSIGSLFNSGGPGSSTNVAGINMNFPVNQSLMIGDYAAAVSGQTIPPYKPI